MSSARARREVIVAMAAMAGVERDGGDDDDDVSDGVGGGMLVLVLGGVDVVRGGVEVGVGRVVDCVLLV